MYPYHEYVRLTHLPTGTIAQSRDCAPRRNKVAWYTAWARKLLLARLCRPTDAPPPIRRTYDLNPPWGIEPNIRQGDRWLVSGREDVLEVLGGKMDALIEWKPPKA